MENKAILTGRERFFDQDEIIVSKTDLKGHIQYANRVFMRVGAFEDNEVMGAPHSILRHPDMPRCVFKLLWDRIQEGHELFAYVLNRANNGDHYWVLAHVTPSFDGSGNLNGYHSNRRVPNREAVSSVVVPLYKKLVGIEDAHSNRKDGMHASFAELQRILKEKGSTYDEFVFSI